MDAEYLKKKYERLYRVAFKMRHHQIRYSKYGTGIDRDKARYYQQQLDGLLKEESELKKSLLQELF